MTLTSSLWYSIADDGGIVRKGSAGLNMDRLKRRRVAEQVATMSANCESRT